MKKLIVLVGLIISMTFFQSCENVNAPQVQPNSERNFVWQADTLRNAIPRNLEVSGMDNIYVLTLDLNVNNHPDVMFNLHHFDGKNFVKANTESTGGYSSITKYNNKYFFTGEEGIYSLEPGGGFTRQYAAERLNASFYYPKIIDGIMYFARWNSSNRTFTIVRNDNGFWNDQSYFFEDDVYMTNSIMYESFDRFYISTLSQFGQRIHFFNKGKISVVPDIVPLKMFYLGNTIYVLTQDYKIVRLSNGNSSEWITLEIRNIGEIVGDSENNFFIHYLSMEDGISKSNIAHYDGNDFVNISEFDKKYHSCQIKTFNENVVLLLWENETDYSIVLRGYR